MTYIRSQIASLFMRVLAAISDRAVMFMPREDVAKVYCDIFIILCKSTSSTLTLICFSILKF